MIKDKFSFGRSTKCDFTFHEVKHQISQEVYMQISHRHFTIYKDKDIVYLEDHSSNGTYVNGARVGGDKPGKEIKRQVLLQSEDKITVANPSGPSVFDASYIIFNVILFLGKKGFAFSNPVKFSQPNRNIKLNKKKS
jgi:pSer/pThr/pTyr-binding forkhead associated (FHA) protein